MEKVNLVFMLLAYCARISESNRRNVNYEVVTSAGTSEDRVACAVACADNQYLAARVSDFTGICEGLTWDWGSDLNYEKGFSYIRKIKTVEIYDPAVKIDASFRWLIPGSFGLGGHLEFSITMPTGSNWNGLEINVVDTPESSVDLSDDVLILHILMARDSSVLTFKTWTPNIWTNILSISPIPFADGSTHKVSMLPLLNSFEIYFDDERVVEYSLNTDPAAARQIIFNAYSETIFEIHDITFVGI